MIAVRRRRVGVARLQPPRSETCVAVRSFETLGSQASCHLAVKVEAGLVLDPEAAPKVAVAARHRPAVVDVLARQHSLGGLEDVGLADVVLTE